MASVASQIVAVATEIDYHIDPTRWGSAAVAAHFPGFRHLDIRTSGATNRREDEEKERAGRRAALA